MRDEIEKKEQLVDELTRRNKYLTLLNETSWYLVQNPFLEWADSFTELVQRAGYLAGTPHAFLGLVDLDVVEEEREIEYTTGIGIFSQRTKFFEFLAQEAWTLSQDQERTHWAFVQTFQESPPETGDEVTIPTVMVILLRYKWEFLGIIGIAYDDEASRITSDEEKIELLELLEGFADLVSAGINNSHYYGKILKRLEECESKSNWGR